MARHIDIGETEWGHVTMDPPWAYASQKGTWRLTYRCGAHAMETGARVRFYPPFTFDNSHNSCVRWKPGAVSVEGPATVRLTVRVVDTMQDKFGDAYSINVIEVSVDKGRFVGGEAFTVVMGDQRSGGEPAEAQWLAGPDMPFYAAVAAPGSDNFRALARIPFFEVFGGPAERLTAVAPSTRAEGQPFAITFKAEDALTNTSGVYQNLLMIGANEGVTGPSVAGVALGDRGIKSVDGFRLAAAGTHRVRVADRSGREAVSNPVSTEFSGPDEHIFWGEIHAHTNLGDGVGDENRFYEYARQEALLDFSAISEHAGGRGWWPCFVEAAARHDDPGKFVTLLGYETAWGGGHCNVYTRGLELPVSTSPDRRDKEATAREREEMLRWIAEGRAMLIPHHPNDALIKQAALFRWDQYDPALIRLAEICQMRGSFEMDRPGSHVLFEGYGCSIQDGLRQGVRCGFTGGTDNHCGRPGSTMKVCFHAGHRVGSAETCDLQRGYIDRTLCGLTAVFAPDLRREAIYDALHARRCYATTGARILLRFEVNALPMGSEGAYQGLADIRVQVAGTAPIKRITIVRNNEDVHVEPGRGWDQALEWEDPAARPGSWYYARVEQEDGHLAWASPVWLD